MKKFSEITNNDENKTTLKSTNTTDFITNLVNESLSVDGENINGKDALISTLIELVNINESKTIIKTLENVKLNSFKHLNMNWVNESIDTQRNILNTSDNTDSIEEQVDQTLVAQAKEEVELINESTEVEKVEEITEAKSECDCEDGECDCKPKDKEEETDVENDEEETEVNESNLEIISAVNVLDTDDIKSYLENAGYAVYGDESEIELKQALVQGIEKGDIELDNMNQSFVTESTYVVDSGSQELNNLSNIYASIMNESVETEKNSDELNFKSFKEMFGVQMNQFTNEGVIFNYHGEELDFVEKMIFENRVASIIEEDGNKTLVNGFKTENRTGYIVTERSMNESLNINLKR